MDEIRASLARTPAVASERGLVGIVFTVAVFLNASLLFCVEPMLGKMLLPALGGSPAVWNTCMAFFQVVLLAGYAYAHFSVDRLGIRKQVLLHGIVLALPLFFLPLGMKTSTATPSPWTVLGILAQTALVPFFVLSTGGTLLQRWYAAAAPNKNPYRLYAASNAGSLVALIAYPLVIEPLLPVGIQNRGFAKAYVVLLVVLALAGLYARRGSIDLTGDSVTNLATLDAEDEAPTKRRIASWVLYAFVPSSLLLGVTNFITMDMSPTPFLWVLPLALYLGTFVIAFGKWSGVLPRWARTAMMASMVILAIGMVAGRSATPLVALHLAVFFGLVLGLHGRLASLKPSATRLTQYFMWVSFGGALGGLFNTFLAPVLFRRVGFFIEYPIALGAGLALLGAGSEKLGHWRREALGLVAVFGSVLVAMAIRDAHPALELGAFLFPVLVILTLRESPLRFGTAIAIFAVVGSFLDGGKNPFVERTPFGILRVTTSDDAHALLFHGTTLHGGVFGPKDADGRDVARAYYNPRGPIGSLFARRAELGLAEGKVDVVGLGTGALAYYAKPGEQWTYFEIDPVVVKVAQDTRYFRFLSESRAASIQHVVGDARLRLEGEENGSVSLLVVDAFSSDAIPTHLLTEEAFALYASKLGKDGVLAVHVSNRHYRLAPVVAAGGASANLVARAFTDDGTIDPSKQEGDVRLPSCWVALGSKETMEKLALPAHWVATVPAAQAWRDDFSNVLAALKR